MISSIERVKTVEEHLNSQIIGQEDAIHRVSQALQSAEFHVNDTGPRPKGAFLFMGPTGVGKSETCKIFNAYLFGNEKLSMMFCNEYQQASHVADLILFIKRAVKLYPQGTVLLCDEIEKAHKAIIDIFISLIDEGCITDETGARTFITNCYVVMTSNIGAERWGQMEQTPYSTMEEFALGQARKKLRPELVARLTETIVYRPLSVETQVKILKQLMGWKLAHVESRLLELLGFKGELSVDENVNAFLLHHGFTQTGGARFLRQEVDRRINHAVLPWITSGKCPEEGKFYANPGRNRLELR